MPPKARPPAPIDRPLSKAYLREFAGWSTAYPPGLSEPNSIRDMQNIQVTREGAARVRPGLRSYMRTKSPLPLVGSHEVFYLPNGKAYLVAVRETVDVGTASEREIVGFRVIGPDASGAIVMGTLAEFGFAVPAEPNVLSFTAATTYVKYLQIDNKIFALSNAPEGMLMFWVGDEKKAKKLQSITRPAWNTADKLTAVHPNGAWVTGNLPASTRTNLCTNPDLETAETGWLSGSKWTNTYRSVVHSVGGYGLGAEPLPERINYATSPLHNVAATGTAGWSAVYGAVSVSGSNLRFIENRTNLSYAYARTGMLSVPSGQRFVLAFDLAGASYVGRLRAWVAFYRASGDWISTTSVMSSTSLTTGRKKGTAVTIPTQAKFARVQIGLEPSRTAASQPGRIDINDVFFGPDAYNNSLALDGDDGAGYYWEGAVNASRSLYQPARDVVAGFAPTAVTPGQYTISMDIRGAAGRTVEFQVRALNATGTTVLQVVDTSVGTGAHVRRSVTINVPTGATRIQPWVYMKAALRPERLYLDACLIERAGSAGTYFSGNTASAGTTKRRWTGAANASTSVEEVWDPILPPPQVPADGSLISSNQTKNKYSFSFFYTISNELGESAPSQVTTIKVQRPWTAWQWLDPAGVDTSDPNKCADQLVVTMPLEVFNNAVASGATKWTAYYYAQGPNDAPSVTALRFAEIDLTNEPVHLQHGYARLTPQMSRIGIGDPLVPSESTRVNASNPVKGATGIVAADRLILVGNPADPARITWSSGAPGDYHNFSPLLGGGSKQLTSGNLYVTATVKLWQNPQSVDTLTILNAGDDGRSNAYYMQPANITSLSESISVMGFEEVTALPGTVSPYGVEVVSNGLYRPLFHGLFKSTANNYNISTKSVSDSIQNSWRTLQSPHHIVSAQLDSRIYFLVHNVFGDVLEPNCWGNEVWVIDIAATTPSWSKWSVQGSSLRAMDVDDVVMMSVVHPDGIFTFNEDRYTDERFNKSTGVLEVVNIPWYLETNTQGANRAHDAWCNLQQANVMVGNFLGQLRYGIRGKDVNGMDVVMEKVVLSDNPPPDGVTDEEILDGYIMPTLAPTEREDYLLVRKIMKEWVFFAGSVNDTVDSDPVDLVVPRFGAGQVNSVQYRYTPATVNVGYEYGSVETFEYGAAYAAEATTDSGTPQPYVDLSRA
jgi:hypothetical protein